MCGPGPARFETCLSVVKQMFVQQLVSSGIRPCQQLRPSSWHRDVIVKLPLGLKILRNQFHAPQAHVVVGGSGGIPP